MICVELFIIIPAQIQTEPAFGSRQPRTKQTQQGARRNEEEEEE